MTRSSDLIARANKALDNNENLRPAMQELLIEYKIAVDQALTAEAAVHRAIKLLEIATNNGQASLF